MPVCLQLIDTFRSTVKVNLLCKHTCYCIALLIHMFTPRWLLNNNMYVGHIIYVVPFQPVLLVRDFVLHISDMMYK